MSKKTKPPESNVGHTAKFIVPIRCGGNVKFRVAVKIIGLRKKFGRDDYEITPVSGDGTAFVSSKNLEDIEP